MFDLIVKNATLTDGRSGIDIACRDGAIAALEPGITAPAKEVLDAGGYLVSPPFVDPHFHMDATLSLGRPRMNVSGTLLEGIALWGELKEIQTVDEIVARAVQYCELAVAKGYGRAGRPVGLLAVLAARRIKRLRALQGDPLDPRADAPDPWAIWALSWHAWRGR